jgi:hypothetical protein
MGKKARKADKLGKSEKLDLILAEIAKLKGEIKALGKQQAALVERIGTPSARKATPRPAGKTAKSAPAAKSPARKSTPAPKRPVLVAAAEATTSTPRTAAQ